MARVIEAPREKTMKCKHCFATIGYDNSDVETLTMFPPADYPNLPKDWEALVIKKMICPYCGKTIYLDE